MELCRMSLEEKADTRRKKNQKFSEDELRKIMRDVTLGLKGLHDRSIVHLHIKPENVLLSQSGKYKLGDLGLARLLKHPIIIQ